MGIGRAGRYELLARLGEGGMAELFLARPLGDRGQHVFVLKRILPKHAHDRKFVAMFMRELDIASVVCHPNLVSVVDHGEADGHYFMVMEYVHGTDLAQLLDACADADLQVPIAVAMTIVQQASRGLHALHEQVDRQGGKPQLVHRDVTPSNVMLSYEGAVKVTDFGIATATAYTRTTDAGTVKGKMGYLSPEQCRGDVLDRRSDVYALGILLYEATVGQRLFVADNDYAMMNLIVSGRFDRPSKRRSGYPPGLEAIVMRALETEASRRYATAADLADALERFAAASGLKLGAGVVAAWCGRAVPHRPYPHYPAPAPTGPVAPVVAAPLPMIAAPTRRPRWIVPVAAAVVLGAVGVGVAASSQAPVAAATVEPSVSQPVAASPAPITPAPAVAPTVAPAPPVEPAAIAEAEPVEVIEIVEEPPPPTAVPRKRKRSRKAPSKPSHYDLDAPRPPQ